MLDRDPGALGRNEIAAATATAATIVTVRQTVAPEWMDQGGGCKQIKRNLLPGVRQRGSLAADLEAVDGRANTCGGWTTMFEIDAGPRQAMARFEDAVLEIPIRFRSVHGATASGPDAQGMRLAMAG